ncbi:MAG: dihydroorotate dehydrogenase electron transfer subunit [Nitrospirae bacterium]|nr:dihydroorotate dehydrogenase electron transfer subunit [Nitrospirota bacterium]
MAKNHFLLTAHPLNTMPSPDPGQFFMLSVDSRLDPLLKRPFSLHRLVLGDLQFLYRVVGKATNILKDKKAGDIMELIGPLGNGFPVNEIEEKKPVLIAGGMGIAPLVALAEKFTERQPVFFYGARNAEEILCLNELESIGITPVISTDDGTSGRKGFVTDIVEEFLYHHPSSSFDYALYSCGPKPMLETLSGIAMKYKIKAYMALEESMACGIGACLGCVIKTVDGYKRVCKEGPVFLSEEIIW